jgi:hypothetical protein
LRSGLRDGRRIGGVRTILVFRSRTALPVLLERWNFRGRDDVVARVAQRSLVAPRLRDGSSWEAGRDSGA